MPDAAGPSIATTRGRRRSSAPDAGEVSYAWTYEAAEFEIGACVSGAATPLREGTEAEFITEHYWGYTRQRDGRTLEYQVEHPRWRVWTADASWFRGPAASLYGPDFGRVLSAEPRSAFVAVGSPIAVHHGRALEQETGNRTQDAGRRTQDAGHRTEVGR